MKTKYAEKCAKIGAVCDCGGRERLYYVVQDIEYAVCHISHFADHTLLKILRRNHVFGAEVLITAIFAQ